jgi:sulfur-oxidizing protein SoxZ
MANMKIKAKAKGDTLKCKVQAKHIMLPYNAAKKKGVDANFIVHISGKAGDRVVFDASTSQFLSKNPIFKFEATAEGLKKGDKLEMTWTDLSGKTVTESKKIKGLK